MIEKRNSLFALIAGLLISSIVLADVLNLADVAVLQYASSVILSAICGLLFFSWWVVNGWRASAVYLWVMFLLFAVAYADAGNLHARLIWLGYVAGDYADFVNSDQWLYRGTGKIMSLSFLVSFIVSQRLKK